MPETAMTEGPKNSPKLTHWYKKWWFITIVILIILWFGLPLVLNIFFSTSSKVGGSSQLPGKNNSSSSEVYNVATTDDPSLGAPEAPVTIVEFGDFQCPYSRAAALIIRKIAREYPEAVRVIYRDFPIPELHDQAVPAAQAAHCAAAQGKFWEYHDELFKQQERLNSELYRLLAITIKLNISEFDKCWLSAKTVAEVQDDYQAGLAASVTGTPTWFINGHKVQGVIPLELWRQIILATLKNKFTPSL